MKKIAIVLAGCGHRDGAEITEAVSTLISISQAGAQYEIFAPAIQFTPTNHQTGELMGGETRNILTESGRISRGQTKNLKELEEKDFDAVIFPGGYGAALHLSDWGTKGHFCTVHPDVERVIRSFHRASKPIGAICIAPTLVAKVLGAEGVTLTIGNNKEVITEIEKTGSEHVECPPDDFITDRLHKVITTPAYMYDTEPHKVFKGIQGLVNELVEMA